MTPFRTVNTDVAHAVLACFRMIALAQDNLMHLTDTCPLLFSGDISGLGREIGVGLLPHRVWLLAEPRASQQRQLHVSLLFLSLSTHSKDRSDLHYGVSNTPVAV